MMILCPSVCLSHHATAVPTCGRFAAERRAYTISGAAALVTARHSAANVTFTADVGIRKLTSDLFPQANNQWLFEGGGVVSL